MRSVEAVEADAGRTSGTLSADGDLRPSSPLRLMAGPAAGVPASKFMGEGVLDDVCSAVAVASSAPSMTMGIVTSQPAVGVDCARSFGQTADPESVNESRLSMEERSSGCVARGSGNISSAYRSRLRS
eukprot:6195363-Pleurochrysis_carterae.AAC.8